MKRGVIERRHGVGKDHLAHHAVAQQIGEAFLRVPVFVFLGTDVAFGGVFVTAPPGVEIGAVLWIQVIAIGVNGRAGVRIGGNYNIGVIAHGGVTASGGLGIKLLVVLPDLVNRAVAVAQYRIFMEFLVLPDGHVLAMLPRHFADEGFRQSLCGFEIAVHDFEAETHHRLMVLTIHRRPGDDNQRLANPLEAGDADTAAV